MFRRQEPVRSSPALSAPQPFPCVSGAWGSGMVSGGASDFIVYVLIHVTCLSLFITNTSWLRVCVPCATEDRCPLHLLVVGQGMGSPPFPLSPLPSSSLSSSSSPSPSSSPSLFPSHSALLAALTFCGLWKIDGASRHLRSLICILCFSQNWDVPFFSITWHLSCCFQLAGSVRSHLPGAPTCGSDLWALASPWMSAQAEVRASHPGRL